LSWLVCLATQFIAGSTTGSWGSGGTEEVLPGRGLGDCGDSWEEHLPLKLIIFNLHSTSNRQPGLFLKEKL
jgi:hypothetical protein